MPSLHYPVLLPACSWPSAIVGPDVGRETVAVLVRRVYEGFIMEMDAIDNGVSVADGPQRYQLRAVAAFCAYALGLLSEWPC